MLGHNNLVILVILLFVSIIEIFDLVSEKENGTRYAVSAYENQL
jgi:uncharacterized protein (UPF0333 family)